MTMTSIKMMTRTGQELSGTPHTSSGWDFSRFLLLQNNALNKYNWCEMIFVSWCSQHVLKVIADVTNKFYSRKFNFKTLLKHFDIFQQLLLVNNKRKQNDLPRKIDIKMLMTNCERNSDLTFFFQGTAGLTFGFLHPNGVHGRIVLWK